MRNYIVSGNNRTERQMDKVRSAHDVSGVPKSQWSLAHKHISISVGVAKGKLL
jgi:hypothetical protein